MYGYIFPGEVRFDFTRFFQQAWFFDALFLGNIRFNGVHFSDHAGFDGAKFESDAWFNSTFAGSAWFRNALFSSDVIFADATFKGYTTFQGARFRKAAAFNAIRSERAFDLSDAFFEGAPDFIQAHFEEAPRLDNVLIRGNRAEFPWPTVVHSSERDIPARWRALKRLAVQSHDTDRELQFFAAEVRSARYNYDWPLPLQIESEAWGGALRFYAGWLYQIFSDFGRSLARPFSFWLAAVAFGAVFYVSQSPEIIAQQAKMEQKGASQISAVFATAWHAWWLHPRSCYVGQPQPEGANPPPYVGALSRLRDGTGLANEAWHLAFRNAFIVLDGSSEAAHRTYGCLYGVEMYGGSNPLAVVPSAVSTCPPSRSCSRL